MTEPDEKVDEAYRNAARNQYHREGEIEIDDKATVSISEDGGAYVQAWVWVYNDSAGICRECGQANPDSGEGWDGICGICEDGEG